MKELSPEHLNLLEMIVRCYDCCLSCAAHLTVVDEDGKEILQRNLFVGGAY